MDTATKIRLMVNDALKEAHGKVEDAVNWADLRCVEVTRCQDYYMVVISEAAPDAWKLREFVQEYLEKHGYYDVVITTEW